MTLKCAHNNKFHIFVISISSATTMFLQFVKHFLTKINFIPIGHHNKRNLHLLKKHLLYNHFFMHRIKCVLDRKKSSKICSLNLIRLLWTKFFQPLHSLDKNLDVRLHLHAEGCNSRLDLNEKMRK